MLQRRARPGPGPSDRIDGRSADRVGCHPVEDRPGGCLERRHGVRSGKDHRAAVGTPLRRGIGFGGMLGDGLVPDQKRSIGDGGTLGITQPTEGGRVAGQDLVLGIERDVAGARG